MSTLYVARKANLITKQENTQRTRNKYKLFDNEAHEIY